MTISLAPVRRTNSMGAAMNVLLPCSDHRCLLSDPPTKARQPDVKVLACRCGEGAVPG